MESGTITVYEFGDVSGAIAAFDYFRRPGTAHLDPRLVDQVASDRSDRLWVVFRSGVNVVREDFDSHGDTLGIVAHELIEHLPKVSGSAAQPPLLPTLLPVKGLDVDSVKYALGPLGYQALGGVLPADVVGFDKSAEVVTAKYKGGGGLTLLLYPTPQIAGDRGRVIETQMNRTVANDAGRAAAGTVMLRREGPLVAMTTGPWSAADAHAMVEGVHLRSEVSFDKPMPLEFQAEVKKTYSLLESIAIFCGFSAVAMVVLGLFFGGGRAAVRVLQGKPAASEPEFLHIDLSGSGGKRLRGPEA
jgi:hypothetical protein